MFNKLFYLIILFCLSSTISYSQKRIMIQSVDLIEGKKRFSIFSSNSGSGQALRSVPPFCINFFANNKKFIVIDRQNLKMINEEKELQKSEEFIDGYIVDQGKSEGADYVLKGIYFENDKKLNLKIYDVGTGTVLCEKSDVFKTNLFGIKNFEERIHNMLHQMLYDGFDIKYSLVRPIESKKEETKTALLAMGKKHKVNVEDRIELFTTTTEKIDGEELSRKVLIGEGEIIEIQDENFSTIKIKKGGKEVNNYLVENKKIYCVVSNKFD